MSEIEYSSQQPTSALERYTINKKLSSSKYPVYRATDNRNYRQVALKIFPIRSQVCKNFKRECEFFNSFNHPNIIKSYEAVDETPSDIDGADGELVSYLSLEYAPYGDLFEIIAECGPMPEKLARSAFHQVIDALSYMHSRNVAHLDLKVENILVDENFKLKLTDFDLSQYIDDDFLESRGTPGYRAPEVKDGVSKDFVAADIYSAGIILFIFLSAMPPYTEMDKGLFTEFDPYYKLMRKNPEKFWEVHSKHKNNSEFYSKDAISLINSMLAEDPTQRPTIDAIRNHPWYQKEIYTDEQFQEEMRSYVLNNRN